MFSDTHLSRERDFEYRIISKDFLWNDRIVPGRSRDIRTGVIRIGIGSAPGHLLYLLLWMFYSEDFTFGLSPI